MVNVQLSNDEYAQLATQAEQCEPRQLIDELAGSYIRQGLARNAAITQPQAQR
jgi:hypothetical protein